MISRSLLRQLPARVTTGAYVLNSGLGKLHPDQQTVVAGAAFTGFAGALLGLYLRTPGMRQKNSLRPAEQGISLAKDVWLLGIGLSLVLDDVTREDR